MNLPNAYRRRTTATPPPKRGWLVAAYVLCALAGAASLLWQSPTVAAAGNWVLVWAALLIVGGAASAYGVACGHWLGEWCGLPPLIAVWLVYGLTNGWLIVSRDDLARTSASLALMAIACFMFWRWQIVARERQAALQVHNRK